MDKDLRPYLAQIFINFSKRSIKLVDDEGYEQNVTFKFDEEGAEGFADTISSINADPHLDSDMVTYCFATA
tara:strand:+ start:1611 stop:1823 length:213 start_codon:yes stop_codon:yes gene_type:complete